MNPEPDAIDDHPKLDRTAFSVVRLTDPDDSLEYWLSRPVASEGFQRVIEVAKLERR